VWYYSALLFLARGKEAAVDVWQWNDSRASGSREIDDQRKGLFTRVKAPLGAFEKGTAGREEISRIVQFLTDYVVFHLGTEEKHMDRFGYSRTKHTRRGTSGS